MALAVGAASPEPQYGIGTRGYPVVAPRPHSLESIWSTSGTLPCPDSHPHRNIHPNAEANTGGTNQGPAYYQECVSLFGKKVFMKPVNE